MAKKAAKKAGKSKGKAAPKKKVRADVHVDLHASSLLLEDYDPLTLDGTPDSFALAMEKESPTVGGGRALVPDEAYAFEVGIPFPALALEYLYSGTVLPLQRLHQMVGPPESGKSAYMFEIGRWIQRYQGFSRIRDTEQKGSAEVMAAIFRYAKAGTEMRPAKSMEDWQTVWSRMFQGYQRTCLGLGPNGKKLAGNKTPPGKIYPLMLGVDSIMGALTRESRQKILDEGFAGRAFPLEAQSLSRYIPVIQGEIEGWPVILAAVNHLNEAQVDGRTVKKKSGGVKLTFSQSIEVEMRKYGPDARFSRGRETGINVMFFLTKNSVGETGRRKIVAPLIFGRETSPKTGEPRLTARWDWHESTARLLSHITNKPYEEPAAVQTKINRLLGLEEHVGKDKRMWYSATALGIKDSDPVSASQFGLAVMKNPEVLAELRDILKIRVDVPFQPGTDYEELRDKAVELRQARRPVAGKPDAASEEEEEELDVPAPAVRFADEDEEE